MIFEMLSKGYSYVCGRDKFYRPIFVINGYMINEFNPTVEDMVTITLWFFDYIQTNLFLKGKIENVIVVINLGN